MFWLGMFCNDILADVRENKEVPFKPWPNESES